MQPKTAAPEKEDRFAADGDAEFGYQTLDIAMAQIESIIAPDSVTDDVGWESVVFLCIHPPMLPMSESYPG